MPLLTVNYFSVFLLLGKESALSVYRHGKSDALVALAVVVAANACSCSLFDGIKKGCHNSPFASLISHSERANISHQSG